MQNSSFKKRRHRSNQSNLELMNNYVLPTYARFNIAPIQGKGSTLTDADGNNYLDCVSGLAVCNLGYSHPQIVKVASDQMRYLTHVSNLYVIQEQAECAEALIKISGLSQAFFCNSGTEAVEAIIKMARFSSLTKFNDSKRIEILVADKSFHGRTMGSISATMQKKYQSGFGPLLKGFKKIKFNNFESIQKAVSPKTCAILLETVQGEGGVYFADSDYWQKLRNLCDEKNIFLILDEVQAGSSRTGKFFAYQNYGIKPDAVTLAKGLGAGFSIGATLVNQEIASFIKPGIHASTFGGNPFACRVALESIRLLNDKKMLKSVCDKGHQFINQLNQLKTKHKIIKEVRGLGLMIACELKKPVGLEIVKKGLEKGVIFNSIQNNIIRFVPPLIITDKEIKKALSVFDELLTEIQ